MQAIILAAGMGKRLRELTKDNTKCMVEVNGVSLIDRMLHQLEKQHLSRIVIVIGYKGERLKEHINTLGIHTPIVYVNNLIYDKTNNIYSLALVKDYLCREDSLLLESDIIFEDAILEKLLQDERETLAVVDKYESWMDGTCFRLNENDSIIEFIPGKKFSYKSINDYYKTVNIYKFSKYFSETYYVPFLVAYQQALGTNEYYEQVLQVIAMLDDPQIKAMRLTGQQWYEIDDIQDLDIAASMFVTNIKNKSELIARRYGGYWRYPEMIDFCYLVNPYFPPQKLISEMKASFEKLLTQYPSGMNVNSLLAGRYFGVKQENILPGNGAAELIKHLMERMEGKIGFIRPTFEEYINRYKECDSVYYLPKNDNFAYTAQDLIAFFSDKEIQCLIVVNPDNPSGNYMSKREVLQLVEWTKENGIQLVIDESFVDFAKEENASIIEQGILEKNQHLYIIKSISKSYGVPGLRLGVLASGNVNLVADLKKEVAIWNINSYAEFFMQIVEKYKKDYAGALDLFKRERERFEKELRKIKGLRVIPSQANYIMVELTGGISASKLTEVLLTKHHLFVKDLSKKILGKEYLRFAVRDTKDNDKLLEAISEVLE